MTFSMSIEQSYSHKPYNWLVVLRIYVASAVFQPYRDLEAGDIQSLEIRVARPGIELRTSCSKCKLSYFQHLLQNLFMDFWWNLVGMKYSWFLTSVVVFPPGSRAGKNKSQGSPSSRNFFRPEGYSKNTKFMHSNDLEACGTYEVLLYLVPFQSQILDPFLDLVKLVILPYFNAISIHFCAVKCFQVCKWNNVYIKDWNGVRVSMNCLCIYLGEGRGYTNVCNVYMVCTCKNTVSLYYRTAQWIFTKLSRDKGLMASAHVSGIWARSFQGRIQGGAK